MIKHINGDILTSKADIICHQVNLDGIMGGGLARQIANKYPAVEESYSRHCKEFKLDVFLGNTLIVPTIEKHIIANCFSQRPDFDTDYTAVRVCFEFVCRYAIKNDLKTIAIPYKYGCGIANGDWQKVYEIIENLANKYTNLNFEIWHYEI